MLTYSLRAITSVLTALLTLLSIHTSSLPSLSEPISLSVADIPKEESGENGVVAILNSREELGLPLQQAVDLFASSHPQTRISVQTVGNPTDYQAIVRSRLLAGDPVDIFHLFGHRDMLELQPYLEDLSSNSWILDALEGTLDAVSLEQAVYGIPYGVEGVGLIANRNIFEAADIPLADIRSLEELREAFVELQRQIDDGELEERFPDLEAVTELPALDRDFLTGCLLNVVLTGQFDSPVQAAQAAYLDFPYAQQSEEFVRLLARYGYAPKWEQYNQVTRREQLENGLAAGRIAVILDTTQSYQALSSAYTEQAFRYALLPIPLEEEPGAIYLGVPAYWAVNRDSAEDAKKTAVEFLTWLYRSDTGAAVVASRFAAVSAYRETAKDTGISLHNQLLALLEKERVLPQVHQEVPSDWANAVFAEEFRSYLSGQAEWEDVLYRSNEQWQYRP